MKDTQKEREYMLKKDLSSLEISYRIRNFLEEHKNDYTEEEREFLLNNCTWGRKTNLVCDLLHQIYDHLGMIEDTTNIYSGFIDLIDQEFGLEQSITEVGGGRIPCLGKHIALRQKKGNITVYDPKMIKEMTKNPPSNLILKKESFTPTTDITNQTLLIGFMPCTATQLLIETACKKKKDFIIALCDGMDGHDDINLDYEINWQLEMIYNARKQLRDNDRGYLEVTDLEEYGISYPIIYSKQK